MHEAIYSEKTDKIYSTRPIEICILHLSLNVAVIGKYMFRISAFLIEVVVFLLSTT
jgi:hypothetical protein